MRLWDVASPATHPSPRRYSEGKIKCLPVENFTFQSMGIQCSLQVASQEWRILQPSEQDLVLKLSSEDKKLEGVHTTHAHPRTCAPGDTLLQASPGNSSASLDPCVPPTGAVTSLMSLSITFGYTRSFCTLFPQAAQSRLPL